MRLLYAVQFELAESEGQTFGSSVQILSVVSSWISDWYQTRKGLDFEFPPADRVVSPISGHELEVIRDFAKDPGVRHTTVSWSYPWDNDGNLFWNSRIEIGEFRGLAEVSFQLSFDSSQYLIAPVEFSLRRPRVIGAILRQFSCTCGDVPLSLEPRELRVEQIGKFVNNTLLSPTRRLPVVLVSRTPVAEKTLVDPSHLADQLAGIAETYCLGDKWAGFALTDMIGKTYSCYNGAVRVYWPGFNPSDSPRSPIYLPEQIFQFGGHFTEQLFKQFASISAFRYVRGPVTTDAIEHLEAERIHETERLRADANDRGDLNELLDLACQENDELQKQNSRIRDENNSLKASLDLAQENFRAISQGPGEAFAEMPATNVARATDLVLETKSVEAAVTSAMANFQSTLTIQNSAFESASNSPFKQPNKVYQALLAMHEVCLSWRESRKSGSKMGTFEMAFEKKGFEYKSRESMTAKGKWGDEYQIQYKDQRVSIEPHLALGKGGPDTCLRIHFYLDEDEEKFVVAHVGRHKTNTRS